MPLVSVVIPTRNRPECAFSLIKMLLECVQDCEVVVCDNSDRDELRILLKDKLSDKRLIYQHKNSRLSVIENFSRGLELATGDYLIFMGDDDLIGPCFEETIRWVKENRIDLLLPNFKGGALQYFWPGVSSARWKGIAGSIFFSKYTGGIENFNPEKTSAQALKRLGSGPLGMPRIYLGLVSKEAVKKAQEKYGALFGGISPDVYSSTLLSSLNLKASWIDYPFVIPGVSSLSTSAARAERTDVGEFKNAGGIIADDHLKGFSNLLWDERVPDFYSPYTVWACSHIAALKKIGKTVPISSLAHLYATCLIFAPRHFKSVYGVIKNQGSFTNFMSYSGLISLMILCVISRYLLQKVKLIKNPRPGGAQFQLTNLPDSISAYKAIEAEFKHLSLRPGYYKDKK
ncbi:glycosyltransferase family 2 protein [Polynucleobacter paneuropaeus]|nr:glycosyltransferase family 2 protein [Polynucleobacter paneuropaeus]